MPAAERVVLAPPEPWDEARVVEAATTLARPEGPLRPGDAVGGLVVWRVAPQAGGVVDARTTLDVLPAPPPRTGQPHVALLFDVAASMATPWGRGQSRQEAAKDAALQFLAARGRDLALATVLTFAKDVSVLAGPFRPTPGARLTLPRPSGPSRLAHALDATLTHLAAQSGDAARTIVVLTDAASQTKALDASAERARRLGVPVHVVVAAPDVDEALDALARTTGGTVTRLRDPPTFDIPQEKTA